MSDMQCPYCGADQEVCHDDGHGYSEDVKHEHTCSACEKSFVFNTFISFFYEASKADCLNGSPHSYQRTKTWPWTASRMRCVYCDSERALTEDERALLAAEHTAPNKEGGAA